MMSGSNLQTAEKTGRCRDVVSVLLHTHHV